MYVLDTNTLVYFFRGDGRVGQHMLQIAPSRIAIPTVVLFELESGLARSSEPAKRRQQLETLLSVVHVLVFDVAAARTAGIVRAQLERIGTPIGPMDTLIAGTALAVGGTLVSRNVREFSRVPGLKLEDWYT